MVGGWRVCVFVKMVNGDTDFRVTARKATEAWMKVYLLMVATY